MVKATWPPYCAAKSKDLRTKDFLLNTYAMKKTQTTDGLQQPLKPLKRFDFGLVTEKLAGLLINVDRDLERKMNAALQRGDVSDERRITLVRMFVRFTRISYAAVRYIAADTPPDPTRLPQYVLVVPNINRQLLDILFSLVYMLDDLEPRSLLYQRAAYRELREEHHQNKTAFSGDEEWQPHFESVEGVLANIVRHLAITEEEQQNPKAIPYWKHPFELKDQKTASRPFLRYLDKWLYGDTSAQAHMSFAGLFRVWPILGADDVGGEAKQMVENRFLPQYRFQHVSRMAVVSLAIATELDTHYALGNSATIDYLWVIFSEYVSEAKEMYELRYQNRVRT